MTRPIATLDQIAPGGMLAVRHGGEEVALCRAGESVFAVSRRCGHKGASLDNGTFEGYIITCPLHRTGEALGPATPADHTAAAEGLLPPEDRDFPSLRVHRVTLRGRDIFIDD
jgi:nitrite reductase/ring-hydroxylating ferredoxin subunit